MLSAISYKLNLVYSISFQLFSKPPNGMNHFPKKQVKKCFWSIGILKLPEYENKPKLTQTLHGESKELSQISLLYYHTTTPITYMPHRGLLLIS